MSEQILYDEAARVARALGHPLRMRIVDMLTHREMGVDEIVRRIGSPLTTVSAQLKTLREARVIETRRQGTRVFNRLADGSIVSLMVTVRSIAEHRSANVQSFMRDFSQHIADVDAVGIGELLGGMDTGEITLVDVRPREEFLAGHIPGAISLPLEQLEQERPNLPKNTQLVAYCRDRYCVLSPKAARLLQQRGFTTERLDIGFAEWIAEHRPVERGASA